jgi:signal transduction histidine kinase/CheY-like chemotaxis protein/HPt (histidine-containing phosphotransfer) domain-containing protein
MSMLAASLERLTSDSVLSDLPTAEGESHAAPIRMPASCRILDALEKVLSLGQEPPSAIQIVSPAGDRLVDTRVFLLACTRLMGGQNQALRRQMTEADAATRAKSAFLADMSHDIRTPMHGILGMTELALETDLSREQREYLYTVRSSAEALLTLLNDILDFSKIEAGKLDLDPFDFHLRDALADALRSLALKAHEKGLELALDVAADVPDRLCADWSRLRQIIVNLVSNAIKFTEQGEILVKVEISDDPAPPAESGPPTCTLKFSVRDTGAGIDADRLAQVFEPYRQADVSTARRHGGTGLGLSISSKLVAMMGGRLWADSTPGRGSNFQFTARVARATKPDGAAPHRAPESLEGLPVLVVDDNATNRRILHEVLTTWRMRPVLAEAGSAALAELQRAQEKGEPFALVLLDALMPGMDGFAVAEQIRRRPGLTSPTIMMLSSAHRQGDTARCRELGVPRYLTKPLKQSDLLNAILDVLAGADSLSEGIRCDPPEAPLSTPASRRFRVLLAEDNAVNQKLAVSLLVKQGHEVVVAGDGRAAAEALEREAFDLVLMDLEMPHMDGLEATARIRAREAGIGRHTPIIAMTAHAMKGDRERCLAGGMDGYLAKPIRAGQLLQVLNEFHVPARRAETTPSQPKIRTAAAMPPGDADIMDKAAILARVGHDGQLLHDLVTVFLNECPRLLADVRAAVEQGDAAKLTTAAHALKGAVSNFSTWPAFEAALRLETMGRTGDLTAAPDGLEALDTALHRLRPALAQLMSVGS